jgi:hypothetical protein
MEAFVVFSFHSTISLSCYSTTMGLLISGKTLPGVMDPYTLWLCTRPNGK